MTKAYVSIGSNVEPEANVRSALRALRERFGPLDTSPVYESAAIGFEGAPFFNLVVAFETDLPPSAVQQTLNAIEDDHGRQRSGPKFSPRTLDLDLVLYGDTVATEGRLRLPRAEVSRYAFVLAPLADIAGDMRHPVTGERFSDMWEAFDRASQPLRRVHLPPV